MHDKIFKHNSAFFNNQSCDLSIEPVAHSTLHVFFCLSSPKKNLINYTYLLLILRESHQCLLTYYIPSTDIPWSRMFGVMESGKAQFGIEDYSLGQTTLEQVFLSFTKKQRSEDNPGP